MKILKYLTLLFGIMPFFAIAQTGGHDLTLSMGNLCEYVGKIQTDENGSTNLCSFNPYFATAIDYRITNHFLLSPEVGISIPKSGRDENISKMSMFVLANAKYKFSEFHYIGGIGLFFTRISGKGGSQTLNNGNTTVSFPMPESSVYTRNLILNLGLGADFSREWSADLHTYVFNLLTTEDRAFSIAINGTYHFGEF